MLYDPSAHKRLADIPWDENLAREAMREAVVAAGSGYDAETGDGRCTLSTAGR